MQAVGLALLAHVGGAHEHARALRVQIEASTDVDELALLQWSSVIPAPVEE